MTENSVGGDPSTGDPPRMQKLVEDGQITPLAQAGRSVSLHLAVGQSRRVPPRLLPAIPRSWPVPEQADLDEVTAQARDHQVIVLGGPSGVGKTALALTWAHQQRDRWPEGQFCANGGLDPVTKEPVAPGDVLRDWLAWLGQYVIPDRLAERAALWRTCIGDRRVLLVVDDVRHAALVKGLLPGGTHWRMLVTAPQPLVSLVTSGAANVLMDRTQHLADPALWCGEGLP